MKIDNSIVNCGFSTTLEIKEQLDPLLHENNYTDSQNFYLLMKSFGYKILGYDYKKIYLKEYVKDKYSLMFEELPQGIILIKDSEYNQFKRKYIDNTTRKRKPRNVSYYSSFYHS